MEIIKLARTGRISISPRESVGMALTRMTQEMIPGLAITDNRRICGVVTLQDLAFYHPNRLILDACIRKTISFSETIDIITAWKAVRDESVDVFPLVDHQGTLKGLLTREDLFAHVFSKQINLGDADLNNSQPRLLVADKNTIVRRKLSRILKETGYHVETATEEKEILGKLKSFSPEIILLQAKLTYANGHDILRRIKADTTLPGLSIIVMISFPEIEDRIQYLEAGADDFLFRPFNEKELLLRIKQQLKIKSLPNDMVKPGRERNEAGLHIKEMQAFNDMIFRNMSSGLIVMDMGGVIEKYNPATLDILHCPPDTDFIGRSIKDIHPALEAFLRVGDSPHKLLELVFPVSSHGQSIMLGYASSYLTGPAGERQGIITLFRDLMEIKKAEEQVRQREETLRALLNAITERMLLTDTAGVILAANEVFAKSVGKRLDLLIGTCVWDHLPQEVVTKRAPYVDKLVRTKEKVIFEDVRQGRYLESVLYPVLNAQGQIEFVATFSKDITESKMAGLALDKKQEETLFLKNMLEKVMDSMMTGLLVTDAAGRISLINRTAMEILETVGEKCLGKPIEFVSPDLAVFKKALPPKNSEYEILIRLSEDNEKYIGFTSTIFHWARGEDGVIIVFKDLTDVKQMREELKIKEKLATVNEISKSIAHEVRNPLFSISASLQILERDFKRAQESNNTQGKATLKLFEILYQETERIDRLLKTLSMIGKSQVLNFMPVNLLELIEFVVQENQGLIAEKHLRVKRNFSKDFPVISLDRDKMVQVIANLLLNAIAFSPNGGEIELVLERESIDSTIKFSIGDEGPGIPIENREKIFAPFFTTRKVGSGLGLFITSQIMELHGGSISTKNKKNRGVVFSFTLPYNPSEN